MNNIPDVCSSPALLGTMKEALPHPAYNQVVESTKRNCTLSGIALSSQVGPEKYWSTQLYYKVLFYVGHLLMISNIRLSTLADVACQIAGAFKW